MSKEFLMPELAESVVEGEIVKWLVDEGAQVQVDDPLVEVMTDKVTVELPSPYAGVLERQLAQEGDVVAVNQAIALFAEDVAKLDQELVDDGESLSLFKPAKDLVDEPVIQIKRPGTKAAVKEKVKGPFGRVLAVPAARKLARDLGLDINTIPGSGPNGRVRVDDVKAFKGQTKPAVSANKVSYISPAEYKDQETRLPVRGLRRAISNQMLASHLQTVRTLHVDEADVTNLVALRDKLRSAALKQGIKLSFLPIILKAVVMALKAFPMLNASLDEAANEIVQKHYYNLGIAVATEQGLVVPVLHEVDKKGILELAQTITELADRARENKLSPQDVKGGTFSITNIGSLGGLFSFPIINVPEAAILGVHSIKKRPVVLDDDSIVARQMLYLSLSFDHRIIDGAEAAMFTSYLIELLETPESLMLEA
ncbi:MAG: 2-oxo acid dehydrogenase subunit E2 [Trueperaceae bacterium]|nr:2-oxo acid dehydrogenase subunit E2 [Trueperaceae bacterium]